MFDKKNAEKPIEKAINQKSFAFFAVSEITNIHKNLDFQSFLGRREVRNPRIDFSKMVN